METNQTNYHHVHVETMPSTITSDETKQDMSQALMTALQPVINRLQSLAADDVVLRSHLRELGRTLLALTEEPQPAKPACEIEAAAPQAPVAAPTPEPAPPAAAPTTNGVVNGHAVPL